MIISRNTTKKQQPTLTMMTKKTPIPTYEVICEESSRFEINNTEVQSDFQDLEEENSTFLTNWQH